MSTNGDDNDKELYLLSDGEDQLAVRQTDPPPEGRPPTPSEPSPVDQSSLGSSDDAADYATIISVEERRQRSRQPVRDVQATELATDQTMEQPESDGSVLPCRPSRVLVTGSGLAGGVLGQQLTFHVDARNGGPGQLAAFCTGPTRLAYCELVDHNNGTFTLSAKPEETGDHVLQVEYEGEAVRGSPFSFPVTASLLADDVTQVTGSVVPCRPSRVLVTGSGLAGGVLGQQLTFHVDARNGGPGVLTAYCTGPSRLAFCELIDQENGTFTLSAKPEETGDHVLQVKYQGEPVLGSPFTFPVTVGSKPDATRVRVSGPGVENGILSTFQSDFAVDTKGAGPGNLSIRMQGPKGAFRMEMSRMSQGDRKVFCHYNPASSGVYIILVKWSNVDVPRSPFHVKIFDHQDEMERDLQRQN